MFSDYNTPTKHTHTSLTHLKIRDVELVVGGQDVGACGGHVHLIPCLLASLIARSRNQPELSHGCKSPVFSCPITTRICKKKEKIYAINSYTVLHTDTTEFECAKRIIHISTMDCFPHFLISHAVNIKGHESHADSVICCTT